MQDFKTILQDGQVEEEIKKSRFICSIKRVYTEEEARSFITAIKKEHYKATHNCSAFILGEKSQIKRSSDDGEPSGTAGVPMLAVLENHDLTNVVVVVTRYFGGIKLGAGGLIRAYSGAVAHGLRELGTVLVTEQEGMSITLSYAQYQELASWLASYEMEAFETEFTTQVTTTIYLDKEQVADAMASLTDYYHGKVELKGCGSRVIERPLLKENLSE